MPGFSNSALRIFQRLLGAPTKPSTAGIKTVLDGNTAIAAIETCIAEAAGLGSSFPTDAVAFAWQMEQQRRGKNCFDKTLTGRDAEGPRGALAAAIGLSMSGARATAFLSSPDLMSAQDLLETAVGRHIPIVVHLTNRTIAAHAGALGSDHKAYHISADSGFFMLHATTVQEAIDFSLVARRVAELTLIPGIVAMDGEQTALAAQDVQLPHPDLVRKFLGDPNDQIKTPSQAQKLLFGETRRRIPRWHDPDRPVMHGAIQGPETWGLGAAAKAPYFNQNLEAILEETLAQLSLQTGRALEPVSNYETDNAEIVLIAQGASVETLQALATYLRKERKIKVGVLGIHSLCPFPGAQIAKYLNKKPVVAVLERMETPLATEPPLMRKIRAALERSVENNQHSTEIHPDYPLIKERQLPSLRSVIYGLGGQALRANDLVELCENFKELDKKSQNRIFLGIEFARASSIYPKRQVLLDNLRRYYPNISELGLRSKIESPDLRPTGAFSIAIHNISDHGGKGLNVETANFLHNLNNGWIRSRPSIFREPWISGWFDNFTYSPTAMLDPGDDYPIDILVLTEPQRLLHPLSSLRKEGVLLAISTLDDAALYQSLSPALRENIQSKQLQLYRVSAKFNTANTANTENQITQTQVLGGLFGTLLDMGLLDLKVRRILNRYEDSLHNLSKTEREVRLENFKAGLESVQRIDYQNLPTPTAEIATWNDEAPMAVRHLGKSGDTYDSLPRFWDQIGVLYRNNETAEMAPDPYMATGIIPPLSSTFRDLSAAREILPAFDPNTCTGCGQCWTRCPDSAIGSVVISPSALIDAGIRLTSGDALRMVAGKITARIHRLGRDTETTTNTAGEFIQTAFTALKDKLPLNEERKKAVTEAIDALIKQLGELPVARTEAFFTEPEQYQHETGEFLSLVINPEACKACGLCISACEPGALTATQQTQQTIEQAHKLWRLWEQIPDTSGATIERASTHPQIGKMPAILLSRHCQLAIAGGDKAEAGSGEKAAVRLALAVAEFQRQPLINKFIKDIAEIREKLMEDIRLNLSNALPTDDLDALAKGLEAIHPSHAPLSALTDEIEGAAEQGLIDAAQLRRRVKISQQLGDLQWRLSEGEHGLGRARLSLAIAPGTITEWAGSWPENPWSMPVAIDMTGDTAQIAAGLLEGQLRDATESIALLRQARLELDKPEEAARASQALKALNWHDLSQEEQRLCPPLLLIGNEEILGGKAYSAITHLLGGTLPIKIMILADLDLALGTANLAGVPMAAAKNSKIDPSLLALSQRNAYIVQTSIGNTNHFLENVKAALEISSPALIYVHAPSPKRHGFASDQTFTQANQAIKSRVFPLFSYNPKGKGVFGSRINIEGNPEPSETWSVTEKENVTTPADWAVLEQRFTPYFVPLNEKDSAPLPLADYLKLDEAARRGKTPIVTISKQKSDEANEKSDENETISLRVEPALLTASEERIDAWRTLQELAGIVTPFTAEVEAKLKEQMADTHQAELTAMKQEYEAQLESLRAEMEGEMATRVKERLMSLAGYTPPQ